jgi:hypothetical protein
MDKRRKVEFPFRTEDNESVIISGVLIDSAYETYLEFKEAFLEEDPLIFFDEDDFSEDDLEKMAEAAEEFLENDGLYRD